MLDSNNTLGPNHSLHPNGLTDFQALSLTPWGFVLSHCHTVRRFEPLMNLFYNQHEMLTLPQGKRPLIIIMMLKNKITSESTDT